MRDEQEERELRTFQRQLVENLGRVLLPLGTLAVLGGIVRNWMAGFEQLLSTSVLPAGMAILVVLHVVRKRLPNGVHATSILVLLAFAALHGGWRLGLSAPALLLIPCEILLAWLLLGTTATIVSCVAMSLGYVGLAWMHMSSGRAPLSPPSSGTIASWVQGGVLLILTTALVLATTRGLVARLLRHVREIERMNADLEERVILRTAAIERSRRDLQAFAAAVSHDLRTPLRAISGFARVLEEDAVEHLTPEDLATLGRIVKGTERMDSLIDALLRLAQLDQVPLRIIEVDMQALASALADELKGAGIAPPSCRFEIASLPRCSTDLDMVRQVLANLLSNACKFSAHRTEPTIRVTWTERADGIWYEVADNGSGFDMAHAHRLFEMFQRLHSDGPEGLGIGLSTVKRILDHLDGAIEPESIPDGGATFRFRPTPARH